MEYLVTMTTHVPDGASNQGVADIRAREAARTHQFALRGRVLRLWRPPRQPGEWRTIGLFDANESADLDQISASMPLRVWRTDTVTPLGPHSNDPGFDRTALNPNCTEFLTTFVLTVPPEISSATVAAVTAREAERTRELAGEGQLAGSGPFLATVATSASGKPATTESSRTRCGRCRWPTG